MHTNSHTHRSIHTRTEYIHIHRHSHSQSALTHIHADSHIHTHRLALPHAHAHSPVSTPSHMHTDVHSLTLIHIHRLTLLHIHGHFHTCAHTLTQPLTARPLPTHSHKAAIAMHTGPLTLSPPRGGVGSFHPPCSQRDFWTLPRRPQSQGRGVFFLGLEAAEPGPGSRDSPLQVCRPQRNSPSCLHPFTSSFSHSPTSMRESPETWQGTHMTVGPGLRGLCPRGRHQTSQAG